MKTTSIVAKAALLIMLLSLAASTAIAQRPVETGEQIRARIEGRHGWTRGTYMGMTGDSISIQVDGRVDRVAPISILQVERHAGERRHTLTGLAIGSLSGAALGAGLGAAAYEPCKPTGELFSCIMAGTQGEYILGGAITGAVLGGVVGALFGRATRTVRWEEASIRTEVSVHASAASASLRITL